MAPLELQTMLKHFAQDRPTLETNNTLDKLQTLLQAEMVEFEESPTPDELADILIFALSIANLMGWDMDEEIRLKLAYNMSRYEAKDFQDGSYEEARLLGKAREVEVKPLFYD